MDVLQISNGRSSARFIEFLTNILKINNYFSIEMYITSRYILKRAF